MNLINVDGWSKSKEEVINTDPFIKEFGFKKSSLGKNVDDDGKYLCGFYKREYKKTEDVIFLNNGRTLCRYKFPKVDIPFSSTMVNWRNLFYCGGYSTTNIDGTDPCSDEALLEGVLCGKKPIGYIVDNKEKIDSYIAKIENTGLKYKVTPREDGINFDLGISNVGIINELFDIAKLIESYELMGVYIYPKLKEQLLEVSKKDLSEILYLEGYTIYSSVKTDFELILTGLILGYSVKSTVAAILGSITY